MLSLVISSIMKQSRNTTAITFSASLSGISRWRSQFHQHKQHAFGIAFVPFHRLDTSYASRNKVVIPMGLKRSQRRTLIIQSKLPYLMHLCHILRQNDPINYLKSCLLCARLINKINGLQLAHNRQQTYVLIGSRLYVIYFIHINKPSYFSLHIFPSVKDVISIDKFNLRTVNLIFLAKIYFQ